MRRIGIAAALGFVIASSAGCDIVKETIEQAVNEQSIRIGDELENFTRDSIENAKSDAMTRAFGGAANAEATGDDPEGEGTSAPRTPNDETFDEFK